MNRKTLISICLGIAGLGVLGGARAADSGPTLLTMLQAQTIAEARLNGRVVKASFDANASPQAYRFHLVTADQQRVQARIAAVGGAVLPSHSTAD
jgi:uncharacterized membrane protein YkoI